MPLKGAGHRAWETRRRNEARRIRDLYRAAFDGDGKMIARGRVVETFRLAGVTTVLDLWGGGVSAEMFTQAGFRVIAVDNGSLEVRDGERVVKSAEKRRALESAASDGGYEARWGPVERFAAEADGAFLDFCGPWTADKRRAISACRHMKAVVVTLMADHDQSVEVTNAIEREFAYQLFLKIAWSGKATWEAMTARGHVRRLLTYRRARGYPVFVYLLGATSVRLTPLTPRQTERLDDRTHQRHLAVKRAWYARHKEEVRTRQAKRMSDPDAKAHKLAVQRARYAANREEVLAKQRVWKERRRADPEWLERQHAYQREYDAKRRARAKSARHAEAGQ